MLNEELASEGRKLMFGQYYWKLCRGTCFVQGNRNLIFPWGGQDQEIE